MNEDFLDLISEFNRASVRYLLVGGYAVGIHGHPRATKDLDLWVQATPKNASNIMSALRSFGAPLAGLTEGDLAKPGAGFMMGLPPRRIDIITEVSGISFAVAVRNAMPADLSPDLSCLVISIDDLIKNKQAAARPQDLADVAALLRIKDLS